LEVRGHLAEHRLDLVEDVGADDYRRLDGVAWGAGLRGYSFYRIAVADVAPSQPCSGRPIGSMNQHIQ
jgi:hypothetical protein